MVQEDRSKESRKPYVVGTAKTRVACNETDRGRAPMRNAIGVAQAAEIVADGATVMIGGFMGVGSPHRLIDALIRRGANGLTIMANDTARPGVGIGKLISAGCASAVIVSHIGTNPETQRKMIDGEIAVELVPQGTLANVSAQQGPVWVAC